MNTVLAKIDSRTVIECNIHTKSRLHLGGEKEGILSAVDLPIVKDQNGHPIIPGSSIKGVLRTYSTRLLHSLPYEKLKQLGFCLSNSKISEKEFQKIREDSEKIQYIQKNLGTIEKLFGYSGLAAPLRITNAVTLNLTTVTCTHIKIDLKTDRIQKGALFSLEAVPEDITFHFKMIYDKPSDDLYNDVNLFFENYLLKWIKDKTGLALFIGGMKSRGYGEVVLKAQQIRIYSIENLLKQETPNPIFERKGE